MTAHRTVGDALRDPNSPLNRRVAAERAARDAGAEIAKLDVVLAALKEQWPAGPVPEGVGDAWNLLHDVRATRAAAQQQASLPEIPADEQGTWALVCQNVD